MAWYHCRGCGQASEAVGLCAVFFGAEGGFQMALRVRDHIIVPASLWDKNLDENLKHLNGAQQPGYQNCTWGRETRPPFLGAPP